MGQNNITGLHMNDFFCKLIVNRHWQPFLPAEKNKHVFYRHRALKYKKTF